MQNGHPHATGPASILSGWTGRALFVVWWKARDRKLVFYLALAVQDFEAKLFEPNSQ